jgi:hypothetical protein
VGEREDDLSALDPTLDWTEICPLSKLSKSESMPAN